MHINICPGMQVKRSLDWLRGESQGNRRYAAVLILREMAENAPAVFNVHVRSFIEIVWAGLRDAKVIVREASVAALRVSPFLDASSAFGSFPFLCLLPLHLASWFCVMSGMCSFFFPLHVACQRLWSPNSALSPASGACYHLPFTPFTRMHALCLAGLTQAAAACHVQETHYLAAMLTKQHQAYQL